VQSVEVIMKRSFAGLLIVSSCLFPMAAQVASDVVSVPEETMRRLLIHRAKPILPGDLRIGTENVVMLKATIDKSGNVENLQMLSGHPMLVGAALDAVKQWKYRPYEVNGIPRVVETTIRVEFSKANEGVTGTSAPPAESPVLVTAEDMRDRFVYKVAPVYPPLARQARIQGTVILRVIINKLGEVRDTQLVNGHPMLAPAAVEAVKKWRYIPYESDGETVEIQTDVQVIFRLPGA
jgi:TonB family protein